MVKNAKDEKQTEAAGNTSESQENVPADGSVRQEAEAAETKVEAPKNFISQPVVYWRKRDEQCPALILKVNPDGSVNLVYFTETVANIGIQVQNVKRGLAPMMFHEDALQVQYAVTCTKRLARFI